MPRQFVEKWVLNGRDDSVNRELDDIRSGYPPPSLSGNQFISGVLYQTASAEFTTLLSIPSARVFRLRNMVVDNDYLAPVNVKFYNYPSASTMSHLGYAMKVAGSGTDHIDGLDFPFRGGPSGGIYMCTDQPSLWVRIYGILIASD